MCVDVGVIEEVNKSPISGPLCRVPLELQFNNAGLVSAGIREEAIEFESIRM